MSAETQNVEVPSNGGSNGEPVAQTTETATDVAAEPVAADANAAVESEAGEKNDDQEMPGDDDTDAQENKKKGAGKEGESNDRRRNVVTAYEDQPESSDPSEICRQVEFYFSDSNLPIDSYLLSQTGGHQNKSVPLKTIHQFKRMRHFQPYTAVRDAIAQSKFLNISDDDELTRKVPLDAKFTEDVMKNKELLTSQDIPRSIYAKGFGDEQKDTAFKIEEFYQAYGPIRSIRLRRKPDGTFKGSAFIEFKDEATQKSFLELDPKPQWNGQDLEIQTKQEYIDAKHQGILDGTVQPRASYVKNSNHNNHNGRGRGGGGRGGGGRGGGRGRGGDRRGRGGGRSHDNRSGDKRKRDWIPEDEWKARRERDQKNGGRSNRDRSNSPARKSRRENGDGESKNDADAPAKSSAEAPVEKKDTAAPGVEA